MIIFHYVSGNIPDVFDVIHTSIISYNQKYDYVGIDLGITHILHFLNKGKVGNAHPTKN